MKVFLSYSRRDESVAHFLAYILQKNGVKCLVDRNLRAGTVFDEKLRFMIEESDLVLVLLTSSSLASPWVNQEIGYALAQKKEVWPLAMETDLTPTGMLAGLQAFSLFDWSRPFETIDSLVTALAAPVSAPVSSLGAHFDQVITGRIERAKFLASVFKRLLDERPSGLTVLVQAAFSVFAVSTHPLYRVGEHHSDEYIAALLEEKRLLQGLIELPDSKVRLLLWPVRAYEGKHLAVRYETLASWMRKNRAREGLGFLVGRYIGPNRYILTGRLAIEGYKLHHTPGYEMTVVRKGSGEIDAATEDFNLMYRKAENEGKSKDEAVAQIERLYMESSTAGECSD